MGSDQASLQYHWKTHREFQWRLKQFMDILLFVRFWEIRSYHEFTNNNINRHMWGFNTKCVQYGIVPVNIRIPYLDLGLLFKKIVILQYQQMKVVCIEACVVESWLMIRPGKLAWLYTLQYEIHRLCDKLSKEQSHNWKLSIITFFFSPSMTCRISFML